MHLSQNLSFNKLPLFVHICQLFVPWQSLCEYFDNVSLYSASLTAPNLGLINTLFTDGTIIIQSAFFAHIGVDESDILT